MYLGNQEGYHTSPDDFCCCLAEFEGRQGDREMQEYGAFLIVSYLSKIGAEVRMDQQKTGE